MKNFNDIPDLPDEESLPKWLEDLKSKNPLEVPDGYFEQLPGAIMDKVRNAPSGAPRKRTLVRTLAPIIGIAAMLGLTVFLFFMLKPDSEDQYKEEFASILQDKQAILDYLISNGNLDQDQIVDVLPYAIYNNLNVITQDSIRPQSDSLSMKDKKEMNIQIDSTITPDDILQYLIDEGVSITPDS